MEHDQMVCFVDTTLYYLRRSKYSCFEHRFLSVVMRHVRHLKTICHRFATRNPLRGYLE